MGERCWLQQKAFSLVEVLVVIAIIAVLATAAFAQYQNYSARAKISQGMMIFNNIGENARIYYDQHNVFPNLQQIGLTYDVGDPTQSPMAASLNDYIANYVSYTFAIDQGSTYTCPSIKYGGYISNLAPNDYVTTSRNGSMISVTQLLVYTNHTYKNYCQYFYMHYDPNSQQTTFVSGDFIPTCSNGADDPQSATFFATAGNQC